MRNILTLTNKEKNQNKVCRIKKMYYLCRRNKNTNTNT